MMHEQISLNGAPVVGFGDAGAGISTGMIMAPLLIIPLACTGAVAGHFIKKGTGTAVGAVVGGAIGAWLAYFGSHFSDRGSDAPGPPPPSPGSPPPLPRTP